jgi:hypothetical protein
MATIVVSASAADTPTTGPFNVRRSNRAVTAPPYDHEEDVSTAAVGHPTSHRCHAAVDRHANADPSRPLTHALRYGAYELSE